MGKKRRRRFGMVRKLPSGKFQASYLDSSGQREYAPHTFRGERDAEVWLNNVEVELSRGTWVGSAGSKVILGDYAREYLKSPSIGDAWRTTCDLLLRVHLMDLTGKSLTAITPRMVRQWHEKALAGTGGRVSIAQSYRFLRAVMNQAIRDELIVRNPCQVPGAGADRARERETASPGQVADLVHAILPRYRSPVLIAAWCALRRHEVVGLALGDVDLEAGVLHVRNSKTPAGVRTVAIPPHIIPVIEEARQWSDERWFHTSPRGGQMVANSFYHAFARARKELGLEHLTIHDLRHTGNTLAANAGATTKDLMKRLGHATESAARRYLHAVDGRDGEIAKALSAVAEHGNAARLPNKRI
ncbi:MAG: tyrosine-type recombinase/integrase [Gammaproteobacteria bacterium]